MKSVIPVLGLCWLVLLKPLIAAEDTELPKSQIETHAVRLRFFATDGIGKRLEKMAFGVLIGEKGDGEFSKIGDLIPGTNLQIVGYIPKPADKARGVEDRSELILYDRGTEKQITLPFGPVIEVSVSQAKKEK